MSEAPDPLRALVAFLKADADVNAQTQGRIFNTELPENVTPAMPIKAILVTYSGGLGAFGGGYQQFGDFRADVRCYGNTPAEAREVWHRTLPALKQMRRNVSLGCLLHWAKKGGGPRSMRDPDTKWPFVLSTWQVLAAEVPVPA